MFVACSLSLPHFSILCSATAPLTSSAFQGTLVQNGEFKEVKLSDYEGKWVVLFSYPMDYSKPL
jgi:alkyl hydroperoxide reductase subunit AhpC